MEEEVAILIFNKIMKNFRDIIGVLLSIADAIVLLIISMATIVFLYGLVGYIKKSSDVAGREESRKYIIYGILGLFVMTAVWGLVKILADTFGISAVGIPQIRIY